MTATIAESETVEITSVIEDCRDSSDNLFLATATDGNAKYLVSGDTDLLVLNPYREVQILAPNDFLKQLGHG
ncbi:hypothetical protein Pr1d_53230 [Bythopirellula goksoeyrii]|uniref:PIN domain-containing protein n=1 Tax=Bythopirellula goksoeyrii TaxID=1400387 RepID=A0A5B9QKB7_9BACT|nr:hypothetical protein Pr1d_53230 [Bythopirellula goksoeyrii]